MAKQNPTESRAAAPWRQLTWDDLDGWAGVRSVQRGRSYQRAGHVCDLALTPDGALLAWVQGTYRYATEVRLEGAEQEPELSSRCTCPVGVSCKHAVAVVVDYLEALEEGRAVAAAGATDRRLRRLDEGAEDGESVWDEEEEDAELEPAPPTALRRGRRTGPLPAPTPRRSKKDDVRAYLEGLPQSDLVDYVLRLAQEHEDVRRDLKARSTLARSEAGELVREARREVRRLTAEPAWYNHWSGEGSVPDFGVLRQQFERLLEMGQADALLDLGELLLERGSQQVGMSEDEGETAGEIIRCLDVVFRAVPLSSRPDDRKLLYAIDLMQRDEYDLCQAAGAVLDHDWRPEVWSAVADELSQRLQESPAGGEDFSANYRRDMLSGWLVGALRESGRGAEVLPLLEAEAPRTHSYDRLVAELLARGRLEDARRWALEGIERTRRQWPGIAERLRERLRQMAEGEQNWPLVAAMKAEEFFAYPSVHGLAALEKAARKAGCGAEVCAAALQFLETGVRPVPAGKAPVRRGRKPSAVKATPWPLPGVPPELRPADAPARFERQGPHLDVLLELALKDKRPDDVLRWYDRLRGERPRSRYGHEGVGREPQVADAIVETHPERAAALYREVIESCIGRANPGAYEETLPYLRKLRALLGRRGLEEEWQGYLAHLRETERRKRRLMEVLDRVERKPIVERQ